MNWLENGDVLASIGEFLAEDIGRGDITTTATVPQDTRGFGRFLAKEDLVLCGLDVAEAVFFHLDPDSSEIEASFGDGDEITAGTVFATLKGYADVLLVGERTALNLVQRLSGIATLTRQFVKAIEGTSAQIVDTRKTTPGLRMLEKYAVTIGGGKNHRMGLDDGVLIKDNHIALAGGIPAGIAAVAGLVILVYRRRTTGPVFSATTQAAMTPTSRKSRREFMKEEFPISHLYAPVLSVEMGDF